MAAGYAEERIGTDKRGWGNGLWFVEVGEGSVDLDAEYEVLDGYVLVGLVGDAADARAVAEAGYAGDLARAYPVGASGQYLHAGPLASGLLYGIGELLGEGSVGVLVEAGLVAELPAGLGVGLPPRRDLDSGDARGLYYAFDLIPHGGDACAGR